MRRPHWSNWMPCYWGNFYVVARYELTGHRVEYLGGADQHNRPLVRHADIAVANKALAEHLEKMRLAEQAKARSA